MQPAGKYLGEEYYRAGGLPAVLHELIEAGRIHAALRSRSTARPSARTSSEAKSTDADVILPYDRPLKKHAGFKVLSGNLFDSADHEDERDFGRIPGALPVEPEATPNAFEGRAVVFDGPEDYHHRIDDPSLQIDEHTMLFIRGVGPIGYPGSAEVVNMQPPAALIKQGITSLPCIGDGRQSGTSASPSIVNASPEAAVGGGLALLATGDRVRIDLNNGTANMLLARRRTGAAARGARKAGRLRLPAEPDALAGNPTRAGRPTRRRHGAQARGQISSGRTEERAARQSLTRCHRDAHDASAGAAAPGRFLQRSWNPRSVQPRSRHEPIRPVCR